MFVLSMLGFLSLDRNLYVFHINYFENILLYFPTKRKIKKAFKSVRREVIKSKETIRVVTA